MDKVYERINWQNEPSVATPINATNLNKIDYAVNALDDRVIELGINVGIATGNINTLISDMTTAKSDINLVKTQLGNAQSAMGNLGTRVTKAEADIGALQKDFETLENTKAQGIICTASGEVVSITDCSDMAFSDIAVNGASKQDGIPTMEDEKKIKHVADSGSLEIRVCRKNVFNPESTAYVANLTVNKNNMMFSSTSNVTGTRLYYLPCRPETKYSYSKTVGATVRLLSCPDIPVVGGKITTLSEKSGNVTSITTSANDKYVCIYPLFSTELDKITWDAVLNSIQIEIGEPTDFEPHQSNAITIPLAEPLREYDKAAEQDGVYGVLRGTMSDVFDNTKPWVSSASLVGRYGVVLDGKPNGSCLCTVAVNGLNGSTVLNECFINQNGDFYINTGFDTLDAWKARLAEQSITVEYELAEPVFEPFPAEVQEAIARLHGYKPVTYITTDSEVQPIIDVDYVADTKIYIDNKIIELATAMVAGSEV